MGTFTWKMILSYDIFKTTKENIKFLLYLYSEKDFTMEDLSLKFNISKWVLYKKVKHWKRQKYVAITKTVGRKGGKQYYYQATKKLEIVLKDFLSMLQRGFD